MRRSFFLTACGSFLSLFRWNGSLSFPSYLRCHWKPLSFFWCIDHLHFFIRLFFIFILLRLLLWCLLFLFWRLKWRHFFFFLGNLFLKWLFFFFFFFILFNWLTLFNFSNYRLTLLLCGLFLYHWRLASALYIFSWLCFSFHYSSLLNLRNRLLFRKFLAFLFFTFTLLIITITLIFFTVIFLLL